MASIERKLRRGTLKAKQSQISKFYKYMPGANADKIYEDRLIYNLTNCKFREA